jgi:hypothetical protein
VPRQQVAVEEGYHLRDENPKFFCIHIFTSHAEDILYEKASAVVGILLYKQTSPGLEDSFTEENSFYFYKTDTSTSIT